MNIKLDENLPVDLVPILTALGHNVDTVPGERLEGKPDTVIWDAAQSAARFLITQDLDFADVRKFAPGTHAGIMLVRLRLASRRALIVRVRSVFESERIDQWARCFVVVTERKVRVRRA
jgi:predicted nuclease of predicted toxin-antitoxin system